MLLHICIGGRLQAIRQRNQDEEQGEREYLTYIHLSCNKDRQEKKNTESNNKEINIKVRQENSPDR